jgi:integrase
MRGNITRRGKSSWRIKFDVEPVGGVRQIRYFTVKGTRKDAETELAKQLAAVSAGTFVDPSNMTVGEWLNKWLSSQTLSPRSEETYSTVVARLIAAIGGIKLQKLRPVHVSDMQLRKRDGSPVSASTARQVRRVLKAALQSAMDIELVPRNVAAVGKLPSVEDDEVAILGPADINSVLEALRHTDLDPIVTLALATGMRRGELLALRWQDVDMNAGKVKVERSLEQTKKHGYRFKVPKTRRGRRTITVPQTTIDILREHRRAPLELRMALGMGKPDADALVFCKFDGTPLNADQVTIRWRRAVGGKWKFHALRHTHASALIADGIDIVTISRRLGHSSPAITLRVYSHLFADTDTTAADAIEKVLGANRVPK